MSLVADVLSLQVARVRLQLVLLLGFPLPLPVHERTGVSEPRGHPGGEGGQSHGLEIRDTFTWRGAPEAPGDAEDKKQSSLTL